MRIKERLKDYQTILKKGNRALYGALQTCLEQLPERTEQESLFLHVWAPVLVVFTEWVLEQAARENRRRIYFLARDAHFAFTAAKKICQARQFDIDCRYLPVSRYAMRSAQYALLGEESLNLLCTNGIDATFDKVMQRAGLTPEEADEIAEQTGRLESRKDVLHYAQLQELKEELRRTPLFLDYVQAHAREAMPQTVGFLRQEGLLDDVPYALVDSGWVGTLQQSIEQLIRYEKPSAESLHGYYFGLYERPAGMEKSGYQAFYFSPEDQLRRKARFANSLFEAVFSAPEGMTVAYRSDGQNPPHYEAVKSTEKNPNGTFLERCGELLEVFLEAWLQEIQQEPHTSEKGRTALDGSSDELGHSEKQQSSLTGDDLGQELCEALLSRFMSRPTPEEVGAFGSLLFCDDVLELQLQKVAAELTEDEIRRQRFFNKLLIMTGLRKEVIHESAWIEGSIVRNGKNASAGLRHATAYKYFVYIRKRMKRA